MAWGRDRIAKAAEEVAKHARLVEHVQALQEGQKDLANAIAALGNRMSALEVELRAAKAETKLEAVKETQQILNAVQGGFYDRLSDLSAKVSQLQQDNGGSSPPVISLPKTNSQKGDTDTLPRV
jgi:predicted  nucleic acid-binding Zn-ribbon protein